jgi:hypothetical protein
MASVDEWAAVECGIGGAKTQDLGFAGAGGGAECILASLA